MAGHHPFEQQRRHPWSPSPLHPYRRRPHQRPRRQLRVATPCAHGLHQAVRVLRRLLRAPPPRHPDHQALRQIARVHLLASSSSTTSSPVSPSNLHLVRLLQQPRAASVSSTSPFFCACDHRGGLLCSSDNGVSGCALSLARPVLATPVRAIIPDAFPNLGNLGMSHLMA
uniref:Uncharacterized protein n=1 Tax=Setaria viridis TaxID=4556 RepID=A0A4U6W156_SETVI|nr:hypothetical protein SEVIR_2G286000v2 [Setaria viridis]